MSVSALVRQRDELLRFLLAGFGVVSVDFGVYFLTLWIAPDLPVGVVKAFSFISGAIASFLINRTFVFRSKGVAHRQVGGFVVLYLSSLALNVGVNALALHFDANKPIAWFVATASSTVANFVGMKFVVFRSTPP